MMVPVGIVQKTPEQLAGEKAGQTSMVLGIIGLICNFFVSWWLFGLPSLIMGVIGIMKANEAERFGTAASGGRIMGWINAAFGGLFLVVSVVSCCWVLSARQVLLLPLPTTLLSWSAPWHSSKRSRPPRGYIKAPFLVLRSGAFAYQLALYCPLKMYCAGLCDRCSCTRFGDRLG